MYQKTLLKAVTTTGIGVHSGRDIEMTIMPAPVNNGIEFHIDNGDAIKASVENISCGKLCTVIKEGEEEVGTIEHLMAAFFALGITNAKVFLKGGNEVPIMDGSANEFITILKEAGIQQQGAPAKIFILEKPIKVAYNDTFIIAEPANEFTINYNIDFVHPVIGKQSYTFKEGDCFTSDIAAARTFGMVNQVSELRKLGYARGASLDNAIALDDENILNPEGLRYKDEFVRHKILDSIGDFLLIGGIMKANITVCKGSHYLNHLFAKEFLLNSHLETVEDDSLVSNATINLSPELAVNC